MLSSITVLPIKTSELVSLVVYDNGSEECGNLRKLHDVIAMLSETGLDKEITYFQWLTDETRKLHCFIKIKHYELKAPNISLYPKQFSKINLITGKAETIKSKVFPNHIINPNHEFSIHNWVLVPFADKGQIIGRDRSILKVKFLKWKINYFI